MEENGYTIPNFRKSFSSPTDDYDQLDKDARGLNTAGMDRSMPDYYNT